MTTSTRKLLLILLVLVGISLSFEGAKNMVLLVFGQTTVGSTTHSQMIIGGGTSRFYSMHYTFDTPDRSLGTGSVQVASNRAPRGVIIVRYLPSFPSVNTINVISLIIFWGIVLLLLGGFAVYWGIKQLIKTWDMQTMLQTMGLVGIVGAITLYSMHHDDVRNQPQSGPNVRGNTLSNVANGGYFAAGEQWIYYANANDGNRLYKMFPDGSNKTQLTDDPVMDINVFGDRVFYVVPIMPHGMYRMNSDGSKHKKVLSSSVQHVNMIGDWMYYSNENDFDRIYKATIDGIKKAQLNNDPSDCVQVVDDWIYYINRADDGRMYKMRINGDDRQMLHAHWTNEMVVADGWIYYYGGEDSGLYKMRTDGSDQQQLSTIKSAFLHVAGDWIYYASRDDAETMYRMRTDGSDNEKIYDGKVLFIHSLDDWLYFRGDWGSDEIYRMRKDGSELERIE